MQLEIKNNGEYDREGATRESPIRPSYIVVVVFNLHSVLWSLSLSSSSLVFSSRCVCVCMLCFVVCDWKLYSFNCFNRQEFKKKKKK